jgi:hypothetical protein
MENEQNKQKTNSKMAELTPSVSIITVNENGLHGIKSQSC